MSRERPITVVFGDASLRAVPGLRRQFAVSRGFSVAEVPGGPSEVLAGCRRIGRCVLVIDEPGFNAVDASEFAAAVDFGRAVQVLVTGPSEDEAALERLLQAGCVGVLPAKPRAAILMRAVQAVARGELWVNRRVVTRLLQRFLFRNGSPRLTPREQDILALIAAGCRNRAIAEKLCISHETVRWHIRGLHAKLGIKDRLSTALYAQQLLAQR